MRIIAIITILSIVMSSHAQYYWQDPDYNPIPTAAEYLLLAPDARATGMGQAGVASSPDLYSMHWNPARYSFMENRFGVGVSFSDYLWMKSMWNWNNDMSLSTGFITLNSFCKIKDRSAIAFSLNYFKMFYDFTFTDEFGNVIGTFKPLDINLDLAYSYKISSTFSAGVASRYIFSRLIQTQYVQGGETRNAHSLAFDLAVYYQKALNLGSREGEIRWGVDISNIGMKMSYTNEGDDKDFLPTNLRLGVAFTYNFNDNHSLSIQIDGNKLLVPTPPQYLRDTLTGAPVYDDDGNPVIVKGKDPDVSVCKGMIQSWYDAPGGFEEEMHEWSFASGFEYRYKSYFSARTGLFYEHESKGARRYFTAGAGFQVGVFGADFGLLIPIEEKISDSYLSIFYLRTSLVVSVP